MKEPLVKTRDWSYNPDAPSVRARLMLGLLIALAVASLAILKWGLP